MIIAGFPTIAAKKNIEIHKGLLTYCRIVKNELTEQTNNKLKNQKRTNKNMVYLHSEILFGQRKVYSCDPLILNNKA